MGAARIMSSHSYRFVVLLWAPFQCIVLGAATVIVAEGGGEGGRGRSPCWWVMRGLAHRACRELLCNALGAAAVVVVVTRKGRGRKGPLKRNTVFSKYSNYTTKYFIL